MSGLEKQHRIAVGERFAERLEDRSAVLLGLAETQQGIGLPHTIVDGQKREFSGPNLFILMQVAKDLKWTDPRFFTTAQIEQAGWEIKPAAKQIALQFFTSTNAEGEPLEARATKKALVFNAADIAGVPAKELATVPTVSSIEKALKDAGYITWIEGLDKAVKNWLIDMQLSQIKEGQITALEASLRAEMALSLLEAQTEFKRVVDYGDYLNTGEASRLIRQDPISFNNTAVASEKLFAALMKEIRIVHELRAGLNKGEGGVAKNSFLEKKIDKMFAEREAVLAVPFADKEKAKSLGAVWHTGSKLWFVPKGKSVDDFKEWNPSVHTLGAVATHEMIFSDFRKAMEDLGLDSTRDIIADGKWHYVSVNTQSKKNLAGAYVFNENGGKNGEHVGTIMNKHTGEKCAWSYQGELLTPEQRAKLRAEALVREAIAEKEMAATQDLAATHAKEIWALGVSASTHGYVVRKGIDGSTLRQVAGDVLSKFDEFKGDSGRSIFKPKDNYLLIPMINQSNDLRAVQAISEDGAIKSFMRGGQKKGTMVVLGASSFDELCSQSPAKVAFVEGYATGASFYQATGIPTVICFDAGNLEAVFWQTAGKLPKESEILLAVDNDQFYIERALGFLSDKIGLNSHAEKPEFLPVRSGHEEWRAVPLGEAISDGEWHDCSKGSYKITPEYEDSPEGEGKGFGVRSMLVEVISEDGKKSKQTFNNRGVEAGYAIQALSGVARETQIIRPEFASLSCRPTDWNDLHKREGLNAINTLLQQKYGIQSARQVSPSVLSKEKTTSGVSR